MAKHFGNIVSRKGKFEIIECYGCGFSHLWPLPSSESLKQFYKKLYFQKETSPLLDLKREKRDLNWTNLEYQDVLDVLNKHIKKQGRILDIGCGNGFFCKFMQDNGWQALGLEPSIIASKNAKKIGIPVINTSLEDFLKKKLEGYFDAINCRNVLEHLINPQQTINICRKLLNKKHGILSVNVPNDFNIFQITTQKVLGISQWWVAIPDHINYFNFETIIRLLEKSGFQIIMKTTDFPMELFLLIGEDYVSNPTIGRKCHEKRKRLDLSLPTETRRNFYKALANANFGRSCMIFARVR